jgi:glycosyltransferase involved in cell wall biosynthesis
MFYDAKKILHLTNMTSTKFGGLEHYFIELSRYCKNKGYDSVFQYNTLPQSKYYLNELDKLGVRIIVTNLGDGVFRSIIKTFGLIRTIKPLILQTHFSPPIFTAPMSRFLGVKKSFAFVHALYRLKKTSLKRFDYNWYDKVLCVSNAIANELRDAGVKSKISTHYLGLFGKREKSNEHRKKIRQEFKISDEAMVLACIAFDHSLKGIDILLNAFNIVREKFPKLHLIIVGVDEQSSALPSQASALGLSGCVHWAGIRDAGWQILNAADIYLQPSRSEGLGLAIMEAMSLELPVIASRVGGIPEIVIDEKTGYLFSPEDIPGFSAAISKMLSSPNKARSMGKEGCLKFQQQFQGEKSIKKLVENYYL